MEQNNIKNDRLAIGPDPNLWEYMLMIHPDEDVHIKVLEEKKYFADQYETEVATKLKPHIAIASFFAKEMMEGVLCQWIQGACNQQFSFSILLNNFSGFPCHSVFIRVQNPQPLKKLGVALKALDNLLKTNTCPPIELVTKLHLNIATHLPEEIYNAAIREFAQRCFHQLLNVDKLVLLKRENLYAQWQHVNYFYLPPERNQFN